MHDHISSNTQSPIQKFQEKLKNPKNFENPQNLGLKIHECMKREKIRTLTKCFDLDLGRKCSGWEDLRMRKSFRSREKVFYRERSEKMKIGLRLSYI